VLEAADLVQSGISKRAAVYIAPPSDENDEFIRRGYPSGEYRGETGLAMLNGDGTILRTLACQSLRRG
jgi:hypothetical protein